MSIGRAGRWALAGLAALGAACGHGPDEDVVDDVRLKEFRTCGELDDSIKGAALREMNAQIDLLIENDYSFFARDGAPTSAPAPVPAPAPTPASEARDYSTTNTQERDVDEADFVKNDGSRAFVLQGQQLLKLTTWPPESTRVDWALPVEGHPHEMFLDGDRVVVFSSISLPVERLAASDTYPRYRPAFKAAVLDVSGPAPRTLRELYQEGSYLSARRRGSTVRLVSHGGLQMPPLRYYPDRRVDNPHERRSAYEGLRRKNAELIRAQVLEDWLPRRWEVLDGQTRPSPQACTEYAGTGAPVALGLTTLSSLDLRSAGTGATHSSILNDVSTVYASAQSLYVTAAHWWRPGARLTRDHTYIHKFDVATDPRRARHVASGGVPGYIADQFSLDEEQGLLRIATTRATSDTGWPASTVNDVYVLETRGSRLDVVGQVNGLAPGERIFSARFEGPRGYVVTFRQVDPLFTLDLSDGRRPRQVGELKVPGFSTYLHPLGADHLLTIGRQTDALPDGGVVLGGLSLQVFDVSDLPNPRLVHTHVAGTRSTFSEAEYEHKAFNYFPSRALLAIPTQGSGPSRLYRSSLEVFRVRTAEGIEPLGSVDHSDLNREASGRPRPYFPSVRRSILMEDYVYSISGGGVKVSPVGDLSATVAVVPFPPPGSPPIPTF
jgi:hypothetical protein